MLADNSEVTAATPKPPTSAAAAAAAVDPAATRLRGRLMAHSLGALLDKARGAREVLPHLAALERSLLEKGLVAIDQVPAHWLGRICSQLSSLPIDEQDPPLHDLLRRLMAALQGQRDDGDDDWQRRDVFDAERTVVIREISHSEFEAASQQEANTVLEPRL